MENSKNVAAAAFEAIYDHVLARAAGECPHKADVLDGRKYVRSSGAKRTLTFHNL